MSEKIEATNVAVINPKVVTPKVEVAEEVKKESLFDKLAKERAEKKREKKIKKIEKLQAELEGEETESKLNFDKKKIAGAIGAGVLTVVGLGLAASHHNKGKNGEDDSCDDFCSETDGWSTCGDAETGSDEITYEVKETEAV